MAVFKMIYGAELQKTEQIGHPSRNHPATFYKVCDFILS